MGEEYVSSPREPNGDGALSEEQILFHSVSKDYLIINSPWLIGSLGTIGEDILIFIQFRMYNKVDQTWKDDAVT